MSTEQPSTHTLVPPPSAIFQDELVDPRVSAMLEAPEWAAATIVTGPELTLRDLEGSMPADGGFVLSSLVVPDTNDERKVKDTLHCAKQLGIVPLESKEYGVDHSFSEVSKLAQGPETPCHDEPIVVSESIPLDLKLHDVLKPEPQEEEEAEQ